MNTITINAETAKEIFKQAYNGILANLDVQYTRNDRVQQAEGRDSIIAQHHIKRLNNQLDELVKLAKENHIEL